jgi:hypothetical protein
MAFRGVTVRATVEWADSPHWHRVRKSHWHLRRWGTVIPAERLITSAGDSEGSTLTPDPQPPTIASVPEREFGPVREREAIRFQPEM